MGWLSHVLDSMKLIPHDYVCFDDPLFTTEMCVRQIILFQKRRVKGRRICMSMFLTIDAYTKQQIIKDTRKRN